MVKNEQHNKKLHLTHIFIHVAKLLNFLFLFNEERGEEKCVLTLGGLSLGIFLKQIWLSKSYVIQQLRHLFRVWHWNNYWFEWNHITLKESDKTVQLNDFSRCHIVKPLCLTFEGYYCVNKHKKQTLLHRMEGRLLYFLM